MLDSWKQGLRDEIYLIGERLHNHGERRPPPIQPVIAPAPLAEADAPALELDIKEAPAIPEEERAMYDLIDDDAARRDETNLGLLDDAYGPLLGDDEENLIEF